MILAFESSAKSAGVALMKDGVLLAESFQHTELTHSRTLLKMAEDLLARCEVAVSDLTAVAVAAGPGSFTGLRIGMAAAKGLAWGAELPCIGVSTLEAMARNVALHDGVIASVMDARREQVYFGLFRAEGGELRRICEDCALSLAEAKDRILSQSGEKILVGDGASLCYNTFDEKRDLLLAPEHLRFQRAVGVALSAEIQLKEGGYPSASELKLNYIRLSQAERERANQLLTK